MKSIKIGFSKPKAFFTPFAWIIRKGYGTDFSHVYIRIDLPEYDDQIIFQASGLAVNFMANEIFTANETTVDEFVLNISDEAFLALMKFAMNNVGKPYGVKNCLGLAWVRINALFGRTINNPFKYDGSNYVCSELAGYVLQDIAGIEVDVDVANITPKEVYDTLVKIQATKAS